MPPQPHETEDKRATQPDRDRAYTWKGHMADYGGSTFGPDPCATLMATETELWISGTRGDYRVPRGSVARIGRGNLYPWFFRAVRIHHTLAGISVELQFKPMTVSLAELRSGLERLGYPMK